jgi:hypothetical protein
MNAKVFSVTSPWASNGHVTGGDEVTLSLYPRRAERGSDPPQRDILRVMPV